MKSQAKAVSPAQLQSPSEAEARRRVVALLRDTGHLHRQLSRRRNRDLPVAQGEGRALLYVGAEQGLTQAQLADRLDVQPITLTRQIDRLERDGYVERRSSDQDRRVRLLFLTSEGKALAKRLLKLSRALDEEITAELDTATLERLAEGLASMRAVMLRMRIIENEG